MFVPQVSQTIVDHHSLSRAVPRWRSPPLRTLSAGRLKTVPVPTTRPCVLKCLHKIHTKRGGTVCWHADTHYSIYCSSAQRLPVAPSIPPPTPNPTTVALRFRKNLAQLPRTPPCCALRQQALGFCRNWTAGGVLACSWSTPKLRRPRHLGLALSPSQDVSQWTHFFFFSNPSFLIMRSPGAAPKPDMDYSGIIVDCSELSSSAGDPSQLNPQWKDKDEGRGQTLVLCAIFFFGPPPLLFLGFSTPYRPFFVISVQSSQFFSHNVQFSLYQQCS